jgi:hypothetical protein
MPTGLVENRRLTINKVIYIAYATRTNLAAHSYRERIKTRYRNSVFKSFDVPVFDGIICVRASNDLLLSIDLVDNKVIGRLVADQESDMGGLNRCSLIALALL